MNLARQGLKLQQRHCCCKGKINYAPKCEKYGHYDIKKMGINKM